MLMLGTIILTILPTLDSFAVTVFVVPPPTVDLNRIEKDKPVSQWSNTLGVPPKVDKYNPPLRYMCLLIPTPPDIITLPVE